MVEKFKDLPFDEYMTQMIDAVRMIPKESVVVAANELLAAYDRRSSIYIFGNGGSSAIASHYVNEFSKGCSPVGRPGFKVYSLSDNIPNFSAYANDNGYDRVFADPLSGVLENGDVVIGISSSGNSPNILNAIRVSKEMGARTIGLSGFSGGKLKELADVSIHIPVRHYGIVEDAHMIVGHYLGAHVRRTFADRESAMER